MGLFNFFKKKEIENTGPTENQFLDNTEPEEEQTPNGQSIMGIYNLNEILNYASIDFETRGYQDSLTNPDSSYKHENIELLIMDLDILVQRASNYYTNILKDIDFHINSRKDAGLIDTVKELETKRDKVKENYNSTVKIEEDIKEATGLCKRIKLSYKRGFNRGMASMSSQLLQSNIH
jgi:hypothetical protein